MFKKEISNCIQKEWTEEWQKNPACQMIKIFYPNPDRSKAKQLLNLSRKESRRLIEAIRITYIMYKTRSRKRSTCAGYARKRKKPSPTLSMIAPV